MHARHAVRTPTRAAGERCAGLAERIGSADPDLARRVAGDIVDDDDRTYGLSGLAEQTADPHVARRCANDIPIEPERDRALARITRRPDIDTDQAPQGRG